MPHRGLHRSSAVFSAAREAVEHPSDPSPADGKIQYLPDGALVGEGRTLVRKTGGGGVAMGAFFGTEYKDGYTYTISLKQVGRFYVWGVLRAGNGLAYTVARGRALTPIKAMDDAFAARRKLLQFSAAGTPVAPERETSRPA